MLLQVQEDSDDWLNVDADDFDAKLAETMQASKAVTGNKTASSKMDVDNDGDEDEVAQDQAGKLQNLAKKVEKFVEGQGSLEGALLEE